MGGTHSGSHRKSPGAVSSFICLDPVPGKNFKEGRGELDPECVRTAVAGVWRCLHEWGWSVLEGGHPGELGREQATARGLALWVPWFWGAGWKV